MNRKQRRAQGKTGPTPPRPAPPNLHRLFAEALGHHQAGRLSDAERLYRQILAADPNSAEVHSNLGSALNELGRLDEAVAAFQAAIRINPTMSDTHYNKGIALYNLARFHEAVAAYGAAIRIAPDFFDAHYNLGNALRELGRRDDAVAEYNVAIRIKPDHAEAHSNLGNVLKDMGRRDDALAAYNAAIDTRPDYGDALFNKGIILYDLQQFEGAIEAYTAALRVKPDFADAHFNLGNALKDLGRSEEAITAYTAALRSKPDFADAHVNLGNALKELERSDDAVAAYNAALHIRPDYAEALSNLGSVLYDQGRLNEAVAAHSAALSIKPDCLPYAANTQLLLPIIPETAQAIAIWRERYEKGITALTAGNFVEQPGNLTQYSFYLAYHGQNDRPLMLALARMFRERLPRLTAISPHVATQRSPAASDHRIRVGFLSRYLVDHTIGKLFQGYIRHLDRRRFEVVVIHTARARQDAARQIIDELADKVIVLPRSLDQQHSAIIDENLDVLFYTDIGMDQDSYFISHSRLAPVQAVGWGHPDTTGVESIDYFISATSVEPPDAEEHYSERLIRLNRLPCYYEPPIVPSRIPARQALGLPEDGTLYGCPQSLFKFHPEFDPVLAAIAEGDPGGHIVLIEGPYSSLTEMLKDRWAKSHPVLTERVIFLPRLSADRFMALLAQFDVLLDPIHFGSGNTMYEAMGLGIPIVTWPGNFMRGRLVAGCYQQMEIEDPPIAARREDYAPLALALGGNLQRRQALRDALLQAKEKLFADLHAVREFEAFLGAAADAATRGEKLPGDWRP